MQLEIENSGVTLKQNSPAYFEQPKASTRKELAVESS